MAAGQLALMLDWMASSLAGLAPTGIWVGLDWRVCAKSVGASPAGDGGGAVGIDVGLGGLIASRASSHRDLGWIGLAGWREKMLEIALLAMAVGQSALM
jgi:hypothetical protein